jgi:hypothetical protein
VKNSNQNTKMAIPVAIWVMDSARCWVAWGMDSILGCQNL